MRQEENRFRFRVKGSFNEQAVGPSAVDPRAYGNHDLRHAASRELRRRDPAGQAATDESLATLPGLDGRKMSKSYRNGIPLMASASRRSTKKSKPPWRRCARDRPAVSRRAAARRGPSPAALSAVIPLQSSLPREGEALRFDPMCASEPTCGEGFS
jgi:hypothetical protein